MKRDYVNENDWAPADIEALLDLAARIKSRAEDWRTALSGRCLAMIFEKSSTRTRVSFEAGMFQLGGLGMFLSSKDLQLGRGEPISDTARVVSRYVDGIMARTYAHSTVEELARAASVPVINGLSDLLHPCQALADFLTIRERFGATRGFPLCYIGDGNNVAHSLLVTGAKLGARVAVVTPRGYAPETRVVEWARAAAQETGGKVLVTTSIEEGIAGARAVYTDVWASMGQEAEAGDRAAKFEAYRVTPRVLQMAAPDAIFLHCLPAHRGEEVTSDVIDSPVSAVFDQAENRLHAQKSLLVTLLGSHR
ncbi:MAG TPA: ornithine carbamoyltransferase [Thermoanaerobaculia bacterium]|jgi:ornithine carbamoyltransferase|nr:ornithine carbamoyltransferase [Thermoanaerobaculia bacterium]